jgi:hypothetical protein
MPGARSLGSRDPLVLSLVVAACLLVQAVVAKEVLDVTRDYMSRYAALWIFIAYLVTGPHGRSGTRASRPWPSPSPPRSSRSTPSERPVRAA